MMDKARKRRCKLRTETYEAACSKIEVLHYAGLKQETILAALAKAPGDKGDST